MSVAPTPPVPLDALVREGRIAADWADALAPVANELGAVMAWVDDERRGARAVLPAPHHVLRAFEAPFAAVKVLIVGQDPYPTVGHPIGFAFAVERTVRPLPRSLQNISRELTDDIGAPPLVHGDLARWSEQGVMLLNRVLTVEAGAAGSHAGKGWERVTEHAVRALAARDQPLVALLWGRQAQQLAPLLDGATAVITAAHPSPLAARRGFFGARPFSRANAALSAAGGSTIEWASGHDGSAATESFTGQVEQEQGVRREHR